MTPGEALAALAPDELRAAGAALGGEAGALLLALAEAQERGDDPGPLLEANRALLTRLAEAPALSDRLGPPIDAVARDLDAVRAPLGAAEALRAELLDAFAGLGGGDPEVDALVAAAVDALRADTGLAALAALLPALDALLADLRGAGAGRAPAGLAARAATLEAEAHRAAEAAGRLYAETLALVEEAAALAERRRLPTAGALALQAATLHERLSGAPAAQGRWRRALETALAAGDVASAKHALRRAQLGALDAKEWATVAAWTHRLADLAERLGDRTLATTARAEEAALLARIPAHRADATYMAEQVLRDAEALAPADRAQVDWLVGQLLAELGDPAGAAACHARVVRDAERAAPTFHGRSCLALGRYAEARGDLPAARDLLRRAWESGRSRGDFALFSAAVPALLARLSADGDDDVAARVARDAATRLDGAGLAGAFWSDVADRFGPERARAWSAGA